MTAVLSVNEQAFVGGVAAAKRGVYAPDLELPLGDSRLCLKPVDDSLMTAALLSTWRESNPDAFLTTFPVSAARTKIWLREQVQENQHRALFLVHFAGVPIGHLGLTDYDRSGNSAQIDNVLRGVATDSRYAMEAALRLLIAWAFRSLRLESLQLGVFSDNFKAIKLYEHCMLLTVGSTSMRRYDTGDGWYWSEADGDADTVRVRYYNTMQLTRERFRALEAGWLARFSGGAKQ